MYLTLPSNSSPDVFPENKISDYMVHLPKDLSLPGSWECGLAEIMFPKTWYNVHRYVKQKKEIVDNLFAYQRGHAVVFCFLTPGYYPSPEYLVEHMKSQLQQGLAKENKRLLKSGTISKPVKLLMDIRLNSHTQLVELLLEHKKGAPLREDQLTREMVPDFEFTLYPTVARLLGFSPQSFRKTGLYTAERPSLLGDLSPLYLYCDLIEPRIVGHTVAPLLAVISHQSETTNVVARRYEKLQYHPVIKRNFNDIHISLRDDQGNLVPFRQEKVIVTIHLRPTKLEHL